MIELGFLQSVTAAQPSAIANGVIANVIATNRIAVNAVVDAGSVSVAGNGVAGATGVDALLAGPAPRQPAPAGASLFQIALAAQTPVRIAQPAASTAAIQPGLIAPDPIAVAPVLAPVATSPRIPAPPSPAPMSAALALAQPASVPAALTLAPPLLALSAKVPAVISLRAATVATMSPGLLPVPSSVSALPATPEFPAPSPLAPPVVAAAASDPIPVATDQSLPVTAKPAAHGKLPVPGKPLPVGLPPIAATATLMRVPKADNAAADERIEEKTVAQANAVDPAMPASLALAAAGLQPLTLTVPTKTTPTPTSSTTPVPATPAITPPLPAVSIAMPTLTTPAAALLQPVPAPISITLETKANFAVQSQPLIATPAHPKQGESAVADDRPSSVVPVTAVASDPATPQPDQATAPVSTSALVVAVLPAGTVPAMAVTLLQPPSSRVTASDAVILPPVVMALGPTPANVAPALVTTASLLARQSGPVRDADTKAPKPSSDTPAPAISDGTAALTAPPSFPIVPVGPVAAASVTAPAPQDFAALVDRLVEARAAAQTAAPPHQVSTAVTHAQFGRVSLTFQQDNDGLSVSMASADPGFAPAARSAMAATPATATAGQTGTQPDRSSHPSPGQPAGFSQGFVPQDTPGQITAGATNQNASFAPTSGGSAQSQSRSQPQSQPQPSFTNIAAANRAGPGSTSAAAATDHGIFA